MRCQKKSEEKEEKEKEVKQREAIDDLRLTKVQKF